MSMITPAAPLSDAAFCAKICRIAQEQGWTIDVMDSRAGVSIAFDHRDGRRVAGGICTNKQDALLGACKALLREIYQHL